MTTTDGDSRSHGSSSSSVASSRSQGDDVGRGKWTGKFDFMMSCISYAVGLGNIWRFPYYCHENGGGAFLIPYIIFVLTCGLALFFMEVALGQFLQKSGVTSWEMLTPIFKGIGLASIVMCSLVVMYYNVIVAWSLYYFFVSFQATLPWTECNPEWSTHCCVPTGQAPNASKNCSVSSAQEYWENQVLQISTGLEDMGTIVWPLLGMLALAWVLVYLIIWKGLHASGKILYFTALFPYVVITILLVKAATLDGAVDGVAYYMIPQMEKLAEVDTWLDAGSQVFYSYGVGFASLIALGSYNHKHHNCHRDSIIVGCINSGTSIYAGFLTFSTLGYLAKLYNEDVADVVDSGPGLTFIVYPEAVAQFDTAPQFWSALFFFMMIILGIDSQFCMTEGVISALIDMFPDTLQRYRRRFILLMCVIFFVCSIPLVFEGGMYLFTLMDTYAASGVTLFFIVMCESIAVGWVYGGGRFFRDITEMTKVEPYIYWKWCWKYISLVIMLVIFVCNFIYYEHATYGDYVYPPWGYAIAWTMASVSMVFIPGYMIYYFIITPGTWKERIRMGITPHLNSDIAMEIEEERPANATISHKVDHVMMNHKHNDGKHYNYSYKGDTYTTDETNF